MARFSDSDNGTMKDGRLIVLFDQKSPAGGGPSSKKGAGKGGSGVSGERGGGASGQGAGGAGGKHGAGGANGAGNAGAKGAGAGGKNGAGNNAAGKNGAGGTDGANGANGADAGKSSEGPAKTADDGKPITRSVRAELGSFNFDKSRTFAKVSSFDVLRPVLAYCKGHEDAASQHKLLVVGHADSTGKQELNKALSEARARSVVALLKQDADAWMGNFKLLLGAKASSTDAAFANWDGHEEAQMLDAVLEAASAGDATSPLKTELRPYKANPNKRMTYEIRYKLVRAYMRLLGGALADSFELETLSTR